MNITVPPSSTYNLNEGQKAAADTFLEFLFSDDKEFIISGPAGVGKTYLMNYIVDNTMPRYHEMCKLVGIEPQYGSVQMTATTNKAADVLSKSVKRPTKTIHSFLHLVVRDNYATGETSLERTSTWTPHHNLILFVDEASMIDSLLWKAIHESTVNCKIVYVGDHNQMAPVHEILSPIYKHSSPFVELLQPVRNANQPALMAICQQLRETVSTGEFKPIQLVPGVIDLLDDHQMQSELANTFQQQTHEARILNYTNKRVIQYNDFIRGVRQLPSEPNVGEYLVNASMFHTRRGQIPVEMDLEVVRNHGLSNLQIDKDHQVDLDIYRIDVQDSFGDVWSHVPVPADRNHFDQLVEYYRKAKQWKLYKYLKNEIADFRPHDAATVYKAQGSTYDTVFIDLGNISTCRNPNQVARMLYVAFSRARTRVFLYGDLAPKYGGLIVR